MRLIALACLLATAACSAPQVHTDVVGLNQPCPNGAAPALSVHDASNAFAVCPSAVASR